MTTQNEGGYARQPERGALPPWTVIYERARRFLRAHGHKLWWLHSLYALGLGLFVVAFAQRGFEHARWLAVSLPLTWLLVVVLFRFLGPQSIHSADGARTKLRFYVMTYVLKNLYQGMLFFLLPFYWKSTTIDSVHAWFVFLLGACAVVSTLDIVFDRVLMRWRVLASVFHGITLFGCLNLLIPAIFPDTRTLWSLLWAGGTTVVAFFTLHVPVVWLKQKRMLALLAASVGAGVALVYVAREAIPPVPMHLSSAAVGPFVLPDGRLAMEVKALDASVIEQLLAVTDVVVPGGKGDRLHHVWRRDGQEILRAYEETSRVPGPKGTVRLRSSLMGGQLPSHLGGHWSVDVETEDGQLVGRTTFFVNE